MEYGKTWPGVLRSETQALRSAGLTPDKTHIIPDTCYGTGALDMRDSNTVPSTVSTRRGSYHACSPVEGTSKHPGTPYSNHGPRPTTDAVILRTT